MSSTRSTACCTSDSEEERESHAEPYDREAGCKVTVIFDGQYHVCSARPDDSVRELKLRLAGFLKLPVPYRKRDFMLFKVKRDGYDALEDDDEPLHYHLKGVDNTGCMLCGLTVDNRKGCFSNIDVLQDFGSYDTHRIRISSLDESFTMKDLKMVVTGAINIPCAESMKFKRFESGEDMHEDDNVPCTDCKLRLCLCFG